MLGSSRQHGALAGDSELLGWGGCLPHHCVPTAGPDPSLCFPSPADVTSPGGEPGWKKEPPSGFREPDLSPGKPDSEHYRNHAATTTTATIAAVTRTILIQKPDMKEEETLRRALWVRRARLRQKHSRAGDQARSLLELDRHFIFLLLNHRARKIREFYFWDSCRHTHPHTYIYIYI